MGGFATRLAGLVLAALITIAGAEAQPVMSRCLAVADSAASAIPAAYTVTQLEANQVSITYVGHSTFLIESPLGTRIATDYNGYAGSGVVPDVVTMNHAHETHFTDTPDPRIRHVLRGWKEGGYAAHNLTVNDVFIRNVPTNIRSRMGGTEEFGNSVFIFEMSGLCIGHLGHLHHELTDQQLGQIGQLDIVFVPVDGTYTLDHAGMRDVLKELQARVIIPMHYFSAGGLAGFVQSLGEDWPSRVHEGPRIVLSQANMPASPQVVVLPPF
jgi:L-ascorbate metabolism protein UlaG (beta-lactamase superfamily)